MVDGNRESGKIPEKEPPLLSVVVTITSGANHTSRCLQALSTQRDAPPMEIIVPLYRCIDDEMRLRHDWPGVRFVDMPEEPPSSPGWEHWQYDRRRAMGLAASRGEVIAMTEDHAMPEERWCATIWSQHQINPYGVIGGSIKHHGTRLLNRAVYYCDFARYQPPFPAAAADYVSDINVSYKRAVLERCREVWLDFYNETTVHGKICESGDILYLTPELIVEYDRGPIRLSQILPERFAWGRVFAGRRAQKFGSLRRIVYLSLSLGLAPFLLVRKLLMLCRRGQPLLPFLAALPYTFLCLLFWSMGELVGYATAQPFSPHKRGSEGCTINVTGRANTLK
jgi:hypothetical protein